MADEALDKYEVGEWLGVSYRTVEGFAAQGVLPYSLGGDRARGGPRMQFQPADVGEWIMRHRTTDTELNELLTRDALLSKSEVGNVLRLAPGAVARLRSSGTLPAIEFRHNLVRFHPEDIANMIAEHKAWHEEPEDHGEVADAEVYAQIRAALGTRYTPGRQLLTLREAMKWLGLSAWSVRQLADDGYLPWVSLPPLDSRRFDAYDVQELIERRRPQQRGAWAEFPLKATT